jgi:hypothetical protein
MQQANRLFERRCILGHSAVSGPVALSWSRTTACNNRPMTASALSDFGGGDCLPNQDAFAIILLNDGIYLDVLHLHDEYWHILPSECALPFSIETFVTFFGLSAFTTDGILAVCVNSRLVCYEILRLPRSLLCNICNTLSAIQPSWWEMHRPARSVPAKSCSKIPQ